MYVGYLSDFLTRKTEILVNTSIYKVWICFLTGQRDENSKDEVLTNYADSLWVLFKFLKIQRRCRKMMHLPCFPQEHCGGDTLGIKLPIGNSTDDFGTGASPYYVYFRRYAQGILDIKLRHTGRELRPKFFKIV